MVTCNVLSHDLAVGFHALAGTADSLDSLMMAFLMNGGTKATERTDN